jgi:hypothetical protein
MDRVGWLVGIFGLGYGFHSEYKRKNDRDWVHMALANRKPSIQGPNKDDVTAAINNMMAFLKPPK